MNNENIGLSDDGLTDAEREELSARWERNNPKFLKPREREAYEQWKKNKLQRNPTPTEPQTTPTISQGASSELPSRKEVHPRSKQQSPFFIMTVVAASAALLGGVVGGSLVSFGDDRSNQSSVINSVTSNTAAENSNQMTNSSDLSAVINSNLPSVVTISAYTDEAAGTGSGVVLSEDGYIVTNAHVVTLGGKTSSAELTIQTSTGGTYPASLVGYDATADLAVIKVDASVEGIKPITFASSEDVSVGDDAIAVGAPLALSETVTQGIVSALNRPITVPSSVIQDGAEGTDTAGTTALSVIQTDAAINPGNSGGALLDANGNLIGINVAIEAAAPGSGGSGNIGIGYAIPSNYVKRIATEIIENGSATHALLGATVLNNPVERSIFTAGAKIDSVTPGLAAANGGLLAGDVVTGVNGTVMESSTQLVAYIRQQAPGDEITVDYLRGTEKMTTKLALTAAK